MSITCTHGATVGPVERRGAVLSALPRHRGADLARQMLVRAFANDAVERITLPQVRAYLDQLA